MARPSAVQELEAERPAAPSVPGADLPAANDPVDPPRRARVRALLTWFGVDPRGDSLPVDPDRPCVEGGCGHPALAGDDRCPVHLGLIAPGELPRVVAQSRPNTFRGLALAALAAALGAGLALAIGDLGFGLVGVASTASILGSLLAGRRKRPWLASLLGTAGFFGTSVLACAAALLAGLALLPTLLG